MNFYQIFLPSATLVFLLLIFVLRSIIVWNQTGISPFVFGKTDSAHDYIGLVYKIMTLLTWISIIPFSFITKYYSFLNPIEYLEFNELKIMGITLILIAFIWTATAQIQMSKSWRIGINYEEKTALISHGLFNYSRNPIFLGILVTYLGTFLIAPNTISFSVLLITFFIIQTQVRLEEEYLENVQGKSYLEYKSKVRRWL